MYKIRITNLLGITNEMKSFKEERVWFWYTFYRNNGCRVQVYKDGELIIGRE